MGRRADHEGSIRQRGDGSWEARIQVGGQRISRYGKTRTDVVAKLTELRAAPVLAASDPSLDLQRWVEEWLSEKELRTSAEQTYRRTLAPILSQLGNVRLGRLTQAQLAAIFRLERERGRGARRLQLAHGYLRSCLGRAVEVGHIPANPMLAVARPRWTPATKRYWNLEEYGRFITVAATSPLRYGPLYLLVATTGLRLSEALGLERRDIHNDSITIHTGQVWDRATGYVDERVKTPSSHRTIAVPEAGRAALDAVPFRTAGGQVPRPAMLYATLAALCTEAAVPAVTPHGLRHQHAAVAYHATGDAYAVQARLGHANVTTTMGLYGFGLRDDTATRDALDSLLGDKP